MSPFKWKALGYLLVAAVLLATVARAADAFSSAATATAAAAAAAAAEMKEAMKEEKAAQKGPPQAAYKLPKLFDFEYFKELFGKSYGSLAEELARKRYFFARAFSVFVTGVKYKFRLMPFYSAINHLSDRTDDEREQSMNKLMAEDQRRRQESEQRASPVPVPVPVPAGSQSERPTLVGAGPDSEEGGVASDEAPDFMPNEGENVEQELAKLIEEHANEPGFRELQLELGERRARKKRSLEAPRDFSFERLIASTDPSAERPSEKIVRDVASNNPNYKPFELHSFGLISDMEKVTWTKVRKEDPRPFLEQARDYLGSLFSGGRGEKRTKSAGDASAGGRGASGNGDYAEEELPDEMFLDLRESKCMFVPRNQYSCGACYAFAATAIMEYQFCKKTGKLVALSEQYMIDCGKNRPKRALSGCNGATDGGVANFIHNFGMELRKHYPYLARELTCPFNENIGLKSWGYIRMPIGVTAQVHMSMWAEVLPHGPLYVGVAAGSDFASYGGGIYDGRGCGIFENHAMVLVGHGREDGQEFWLIRNSFGMTWGERGYMKLSKRYAKECTTSRRALAFGSQNGISYPVKPLDPATGVPWTWNDADPAGAGAR